MVELSKAKQSKVMAALVSESTLFVSNLPPNFGTETLEAIFSDVGPLKRCFVVKNRGSQNASSRFGYVTFALKDDAEAARKKIKSIEGRSVNVKFANRRHGHNDGEVERTENGELSEKLKPVKPQQQNKNGRLIVRNLNFQAKVEDVRKKFLPFGKISEIVLPKRPDGKQTGFCFVQFLSTCAAKRALTELNASEILGRPVAVDWALPKSKFVVTQKEAQEHDTKMDDLDNDNDDDRTSAETSETKNETETESEDNVDETGDDDSGAESDEDGEDCEDDDDVSEAASDEDGDDCEDDDDEAEKLPPRKSDVNEGRTLFLRNLTFDTSDDDLMVRFQEFGDIKYAIICVDPDTEHSKGTAFLQFVKKEDADKCLRKASDEGEDGGIIVDGRRVNVSLALSREDMTQKLREKHKKTHKDNRNLYLAREGMIRVGSKAAEEVSASDMQKRAKLEVWKRSKLRNLNYFFSKNRLCIRNLPENLTDDRLRRLCLDAAGTGANITECRIIRKSIAAKVDANDPSKGFGFVSFTTHEHALQTLRQLNNNPETFSKNHRPIIEFSLEDRAAWNSKLQRLKKSKEKLETLKSNDKLKTGGKQREGSLGNKAAGKSAMKKMQPKIDDKSQTFSGAKSQPVKFDPKANARGGLPSHMGPKIRHKKRPGQMVRKKISKRKKLAPTKLKMVDKIEKGSGNRSKKRSHPHSRMDELEARHKTKRQKMDSNLRGKKKTKWFS